MSPITITTKSGTPKEEETKQRLLKLLEKFDVSKYLITSEMIIEEGAIPHSHPVVTINTRTYQIEENILMVFLHEQLHWYLDEHEEAVSKAVEELRKIYPEVPVGYPEGARNEDSTYLHLVLCTLEFNVAKELFGEKMAHDLLEYWKTDVYRWIYRTVQNDYSQLAELINKYKL